jgi:predicted Zn-dependent protease
LVEEDPSRHEAARQLVELCIQQEDEKSLQAARQAILATDKPSPVAATMLIVHDLEKTYRDMDDDSEYGLAVREAQQQVINKAIQDLDELIKLYPDEIQIKLRRASLALMQQDNPTAERYIKEILKENPRNAQARLTEAKMLLLQEKAAEAEAKLFSLKAEFMQWPDAHFYYAQAAEKLGKVELARQAMRTVTELAPRHAGARRYLAETLIRDGFYEQARILLWR